MKTLKKHRIYIPIFDHYIHLYLVDKIEECSAYVDVSQENKSLAVVFQETQIHPDLIVHEVVHLVNRIFHFKGVKLDAENDETQAYLTEYIFNEIYKKLC